MKSRASTSAGDRGCMTIDAGAAADPGVVAPGAAEEGSASSMTTSLRGPRGWHTRGYLPHCDSPALFQSVTFRLSDSLPRETLDRLDAELAQLPSAHRDRARRARIEAWLDAGSGCCALRHPALARYVQDASLHFHGQRYQLHAWCVMPNHVHVLVQPMSDLALIVQGWKSFTARWMFKHAEALGVALPLARRCGCASTGIAMSAMNATICRWSSTSTRTRSRRACAPARRRGRGPVPGAL